MCQFTEGLNKWWVTDHHDNYIIFYDVWNFRSMYCKWMWFSFVCLFENSSSTASSLMGSSRITTNKMSNYQNHLSIIWKCMEGTLGIFAVTGMADEVKDKGNWIWGWRWFYMSSCSVGKYFVLFMCDILWWVDINKWNEYQCRKNHIFIRRQSLSNWATRFDIN